MTITDTGPLVALIDESDLNHQRCLEALQAARLPMLTTVACFTEAMYLLGRSSGAPGQAALWSLTEAKALDICEMTPADLDKARGFMERFKDVPCDFADATILAIADRFDSKVVLTLDGHFNAYRVAGKPLSISPGPRAG